MPPSSMGCWIEGAGNTAVRRRTPNEGKAMTKAELIAALAEVPDNAKMRVFVDEELLHSGEHNDALDVSHVDTSFAVGDKYIRVNQGHPFVTMHLAEAED